MYRLAAELGLQAVGVAPMTPEVSDAYPWARCVVAAAVSYLPPERPPRDQAPRGLVARFARGADYHQVLRGKLDGLAQVLRSRRQGARVEVCVDTCPLPERKLAVLAGIAWRGKSGNVFVDGCGSYASLGEIVTDIELPPSAPCAVDRCGDCNACMRACPTGAITQPFTVDPARCLSRLTQAAGSTPVEFKSKLENRVYGCDACQEVCPQNAAARPISPEFAEETFPGQWPELIPLIRLSPEEFRSKVKASSIGWIRRTRIRRNAAIAAGNLKLSEALSALEEMLRDPDPVLRETAAWAIEEIRADLSN